MRKENYLIIAAILFIVIPLSLSKNLEPKRMSLGDIYKDLYSLLDYNITIIETNMSEITYGSDGWQKLKETNVDDERLKNTYNLLVQDIKKCYLMSNDLKNKTYNNLKIMSFKTKQYITNDQLLKLYNNESCFKDFDKYNSMVLSDNEDLSEKISKQISIIVDYESDDNSYKTFEELLYEELTNTSKIASLSKWLRIEYYSHQM